MCDCRKKVGEGKSFNHWGNLLVINKKVSPLQVFASLFGKLFWSFFHELPSSGKELKNFSDDAGFSVKRVKIEVFKMVLHLVFHRILIQIFTHTKQTKYLKSSMPLEIRLRQSSNTNKLMRGEALKSFRPDPTKCRNLRNVEGGVLWLGQRFSAPSSYSINPNYIWFFALRWMKYALAKYIS